MNEQQPIDDQFLTEPSPEFTAMVALYSGSEVKSGRLPAQKIGGSSLSLSGVELTEFEAVGQELFPPITLRLTKH